MSRSKYFDKLPLLEIAAFVHGNPSRKAVRTWREKSPDSARFSLLAHAALTQEKTFPVDEAAEQVVASLADASNILQAEAVVFRTPASFSPSAGNRQRMQTFFDELATEERFGPAVRVWDPDGLWEPPAIAEVAQSLKLLVAIDPLAQDFMDEKASLVAAQLARGQAYLRISGLGHGRRRFEGYELETLAEMLEELERSWVIFAHPGKYPDAIAMLREITGGV